MIGFDEAIARIREAANLLGTESVPLAEAYRRVLAGTVSARTDSPPADCSAMDGYAVLDADLAALPARLPLAGESFPGRAFAGPMPRGSCVRIFTGAAVPEGDDRVVIQEEVERDGDAATFKQAPAPQSHIRRRGSDFAAGDVLVGPGRLLDARAMVAAAAADVTALTVARRPRLFFLGSGDELVEPGSAHGIPGAIPESVSYGVAAIAQDWGAERIGHLRLRDDLSAMVPAAAQALAAADLVVVTGGASVGDKDFAKAMFEPFGLDLIFSKVAIKPGKPVWFGRVRDTLVLGLPGNPTSALVTARLFLAPLLAGLAGRPIEDALRWRRLPLAREVDSCGDRETFARARWNDGAAELLSNQDSGAQHMLVAADLLIRRPAGAAAASPGTIVDALDF